MDTTVVNIKTGEPFDVFIGRPSKFGNPFIIGSHGTRDEVVDKYRRYLIGNKELLSQIEELRGKRLGCFCEPKNCHGRVIVELLGEK